MGSTVVPLRVLESRGFRVWGVKVSIFKLGFRVCKGFGVSG